MSENPESIMLAETLAADIKSNLDYDDIPYTETVDEEDGSICFLVAVDGGTARITIEKL